MDDLAQVLADARGDAATVRRLGHAEQADYIEGLCDRVQRSAEDWLTWLSETDAAVRCARSAAWLRGRFPALEREGHARTVGRGIRQYRACAIERRADVVSATERGRMAARATRRSA